MTNNQEISLKKDNLSARKYDFNYFELWESLYKKVGTFEGIVEELKRNNVQKIPSAVWAKKCIKKLYISKYGDDYEDIFSKL